MIHVRQKLDTSERRTCKTIGLARSTQRYITHDKNDDGALRLAMIRLAKRYGRYGYRKIAQLLRMEGWAVNHKKVERLWRKKGYSCPAVTRSGNGCITKTAPSFDCAPNILAISGAWILSMTS